MLKKMGFLLSASALLLPTLAMAQTVSAPEVYQDPVSTISISQLLENSIEYNEHYVAVKGVVIAQLAHDEYLILDKTSNRRIQIDLESDVKLPHALRKGDLIQVYGEFDQGNAPEIEVSRLTVISHSN
jgi:uncharacterized protein YdeI (BOF family)